MSQGMNDSVAGLAQLLEMINAGRQQMMGGLDQVHKIPADRTGFGTHGAGGLNSWYLNNPAFRPGESDAAGYARLQDQTRMGQMQRRNEQAAIQNEFLRLKGQEFDMRRAEAGKRGQAWTPQGLMPGAVNVPGGVVSDRPAVNPGFVPSVDNASAAVTFPVPPMPTGAPSVGRRPPTSLAPSASQGGQAPTPQARPVQMTTAEAMQRLTPDPWVEYGAGQDLVKRFTGGLPMTPQNQMRPMPVQQSPLETMSALVGLHPGGTTPKGGLFEAPGQGTYWMPEGDRGYSAADSGTVNETPLQYSQRADAFSQQAGEARNESILRARMQAEVARLLGQRARTQAVAPNVALFDSTQPGFVQTAGMPQQNMQGVFPWMEPLLSGQLTYPGWEQDLYKLLNL